MARTGLEAERGWRSPILPYLYCCRLSGAGHNHTSRGRWIGGRGLFSFLPCQLVPVAQFVLIGSIQVLIAQQHAGEAVSDREEEAHTASLPRHPGHSFLYLVRHWMNRLLLKLLLSSLESPLSKRHFGGFGVIFHRYSCHVVDSVSGGLNGKGVCILFCILSRFLFEDKQFLLREVMMDHNVKREPDTLIKEKYCVVLISMICLWLPANISRRPTFTHIALSFL